MIDWSKFTIVETVVFDDDDEFTSNAHAVTVSNSDHNVIENYANNQLITQQKREQIDDESDVDMDMDEDEDDSAYKIVDDYTPKLGTTKISTSQTKMLDPVSGNVVDINSIGEHMRVQLIDPRWRIEQQKSLDKQKETGITQGDAITANLSKFAEKRSDIFNNSMNNDAKRAKRE